MYQNDEHSSFYIVQRCNVPQVEDLQNEHEPTSALLSYCKRKFLRPYVIILSFSGLGPNATDATACRTRLSYVQAFLISLVLIFGYVLEFCCAYRGDRGFTKPKPPNVYKGGAHTIGELLFGYVIPSFLHLLGYVSAVIVSKIINQEQLQNLVERVFLTSMKPTQLCRSLWIHVAAGFLVLCILYAYVVPSVLMQSQIMQIKWLAEILTDYELPTKILLLSTILVQELVEITVLSSYCIECFLLRVHLVTLSQKLLMHTIDTQDWMRTVITEMICIYLQQQVLEFRKLLDHLNQRVAVPVCFFVVLNLSCAFAGLVYLFNDFDFHYSAIKVVILNIVNVFLWLLIGLLPFFMAASVTRVCQIVQTNGHQIRVRPFVYHNTSSEDLNAVLLFTSSLDMSAKLFRMPIQPNYLCFAVLVVTIVVLTLGMCLNISAFGDV